jgi:hypothetical protein
MTPNNVGDFNDRHHNFDDVPEDDNPADAVPPENDTSAVDDANPLRPLQETSTC